jgi:hypothetical protein
VPRDHLVFVADPVSGFRTRDGGSLRQSSRSSGEHGLDTNAMPDAFVPAVVGYVITSPTEGFGDIRANVCSLNVLDFHQSIEYATDMPCFASPPCV